MSFVLTRSLIGLAQKLHAKPKPSEISLGVKSIGFAPSNQEFPPPGATSGKLAGLPDFPTPSEYKPKIWATAQGA